MTLSPIQLDFYYVESLRWKIESEYDFEKNTPLSLGDLEWNLERADESEDGRQSAYRLTLCLRPTESRYPYSFEIVVVGGFVLSEEVPEERITAVLDNNAPAVLYGAAREVLATSLGRGPFRPPVLPSVHFMNVVRTPQEEQAVEEESVGQRTEEKINVAVEPTALVENGV